MRLTSEACHDWVGMPSREQQLCAVSILGLKSMMCFEQDMFHVCIVTTGCLQILFIAVAATQSVLCSTMSSLRHDQEQPSKVQFQISTNFAGSTKMVQRGRRSRTITVDIGRLVTSYKSTNITCDGATSLTPFDMHRLCH